MKKSASILSTLRNIGPAMLDDFLILGISTLEELAATSPDSLFEQLQRLTGRQQDPCVWDTFAAAIHQARTGEALDWWVFTAQRKARHMQRRNSCLAPPL